MGKDRKYVAIDLKSFYASVECVERGLDPMTTNLVVADPSRTEKTICLAVSPSLKAYGIPGRPRLFEVVQKVRDINRGRSGRLPGKAFSGKSYSAVSLQLDPALELDYIVAVPRMALYMEYSARIYQVYLKYIAPEDIHVYSIDEVFMDVTDYLNTYQLDARGLVRKVIQDIYETTGITATAGIGTNLYLCKVAMDIVAKHAEPDSNGARIAELDEMGYRHQLWGHRPLTDFWRVGRGYARKLEAHGLYTMGDIARCSLGGPQDFHNEDLLYRLFGINAELLIDHAWGWEPCTIADVKAYKPKDSSMCSGQVLHRPYTAQEARLVVHEMAELLSLDLVRKRLAAGQVVLTVGYDIQNLEDPGIRRKYHGEIKTDHYGRQIPKHAHGTATLSCPTSSTKKILEAVLGIYDRTVDGSLLVRRVDVTAARLVPEDTAQENGFVQLNLFTGMVAQEGGRESQEKERKAQEMQLAIQDRFGKNAILKGMNLLDGATARDRNSQIGGHRA